MGNLDAFLLNADELHLNASGVGEAKVYARKKLYLNSSGVGNVEYGGPAQVLKIKNTGVGKVNYIK